MIKVMVIFGTRPEAIKMAPVVQELRRRPDDCDCKVCVTAQHRQILDQVLRFFEIAPHHDLNIMEEGQSPSQIAAKVLMRLGQVLDAEKPHWVLIQGDTTTAMAASLGAFHKRIRVAHIEAGLRTWNKSHPFPEEINRRIVDAVSDLHFAPTETARQNLLKEGISPKSILVTGNTVIDALLETLRKPFSFSGTVLERVPFHKKIILVTAHRRENFGRPLENICRALLDIGREYASEVHIVCPVHPNPNVRATMYDILGRERNVTLTDPLGYQAFVQLMARSYLVVTDSGGLQEEAPSLGKPVLVLREVTERPEAMEAGTVKLVGTERHVIFQETTRLLEDSDEHERMAKATNPYGDGKASQRIVAALFGALDMGWC
jgi:UDP-N-acetylglucosamine 2-epimerase (non-hydrolysing)